MTRVSLGLRRPLARPGIGVPTAAVDPRSLRGRPMSHSDTTVTQPPATAEPAPPPIAIGRYRVERVLGAGRVRRRLPGPRRPAAAAPWPSRCRTAGCVARPEDAEAYLAEARTVAGLDHPHIVPVYDVGQHRPAAPASSSPSSSRAATWPRRLRHGRPSPGRGGRAGGDGGRGAAPRPPAGAGPPRRQAGQHPARRRRQAVSWPTSGWPCGRRTSARGRATPGRPRT